MDSFWENCCTWPNSPHGIVHRFTSLLARWKKNRETTTVLLGLPPPFLVLVRARDEPNNFWQSWFASLYILILAAIGFIRKTSFTMLCYTQFTVCVWSVAGWLIVLWGSLVTMIKASLFCNLYSQTICWGGWDDNALDIAIETQIWGLLAKIYRRKKTGLKFSTGLIHYYFVGLIS